MFRNEDKTEDKHPDFKGEGMINGKKMKISAWTKTIKNGEHAGQKFLSLSFQEPWTGNRSGGRPTARRQTEEDVF